ncbi:MAG: OmpA family protein [Kofleriaceae bacterium]|nr:OmpA family protein [Kofleriaceae bacterium]
MKRLAGVIFALACMTSVAGANVEVGGLAGLHTFSTTSGLGVGEDLDPAMENSLSNSALFGARLGVYFGNSLGVEAEGGIIPTEPRRLVFDVFAAAFRGNLVYQFRAEKPSNKLIPFVLAGAGMLRVVETANESEITKEQNIEVHFGGGAKYRAAGDWGVRLDVRGMGVPSSEEGPTFDFEVLLSIYKEFGRTKPVEKAPPPKDEDPDKDGIIGAADKCPTDPEDMDAFQDEDGCPDGDNDNDGIADAADACKLEPEDKDNFEDENGCPDPDNDQDGIPDLADKCVMEAETKNGFADEDGCADEIPEKLKKFTGAIKGINFKVSSADLAPGSTKALDAAVAVLVEFKDTKLEIQGHTDDQAQKGNKKIADNTALSQARAETVKAYFVSKGIEEGRLIAKGYGETQPVVDPKGLTAGKLTAARATNRRVEFKLISETGGDAAAPATSPAPAPAVAPAPEAAPAPAQP